MWLQGVGQDWETFTFTFHNTRYHQTFPNALPCAQDMQLNMKGSEDWWCISKCLIRELRPMRKTRPVLKAIEKQWHRSSKMVWVESRSGKWYECTRWSDHWGLQRSKYLKEEVLSHIFFYCFFFLIVVDFVIHWNETAFFLIAFFFFFFFELHFKCLWAPATYAVAQGE